MLPTLMFSFGSVLLPLFSAFVYCYCSTSALLAIAVAAGTEWFILCFALWTFWNSFMRWDKLEGGKVGIIIVTVIFQTTIIWPTYDTVQNGFTVPDPSISPLTAQVLKGFLSDAVGEAMMKGEGTHDVLITTSDLAGQTAQVTVSEDGTTSTYVAGGMWMVKGMWTFSGVDNPLASFQNMMVFICWVILIVSLVPLLPPWRTARNYVWKDVLPYALKDTASVIRLNASRMKVHQQLRELQEKNIGGDVSAEEGEIKARIAETEEKILATRRRLMVSQNALFDGSLANLTYFEPRLLNLKPVQCTAEVLSSLSVSIAQISGTAVGFGVVIDHQDDGEFLKNVMEQHLIAAKALDTCATSLKKDDLALLESIPTVLNGIFNDNGGDKESKQEHAELGTTGATHDPFRMHQKAMDIVNLSGKWLVEMSHSSTSHGLSEYFSKSSRRAFVKNILPWLYLQLSHYLYLLRVIVVPFDKKSWNKLELDRNNYAFIQLVWSLKYSIGHAVLMIMTIYWPTFADAFTVADENNPYRSSFVLQNGGWCLVAYSFATTQTTEGSVKKGIMRAFGTALGGVIGWIALVACEDKRYENEFNPYGIIAWLTVTAILTTYFASEKGFEARMSALPNDYGMFVLYSVTTSITIIVYGYFAYGTRECFVR